MNAYYVSSTAHSLLIEHHFQSSKQPSEGSIIMHTFLKIKTRSSLQLCPGRRASLQQFSSQAVWLQDPGSWPLHYTALHGLASTSSQRVGSKEETDTTDASVQERGLQIKNLALTKEKSGLCPWLQEDNL